MKIAIVDDEQSCIEQMKILCQDFETRTGEPTELTCFLGGAEFLNTFQPGVYQIVFMDIFMKGIMKKAVFLAAAGMTALALSGCS